MVAHRTDPTDHHPKGRLPAIERRHQLLTTARIVLADHGYHGTTMADIATEADVTKPVLYQHFASKHDLYRAVLASAANSLEQTVLASLEAATSTREQLDFGVRAFTRFFSDDPISFRLLFDGGVRQDSEWEDIVRSVESTIFDGLATLIDVPTIPFASRQALAHGIIGMAEAMIRFSQRNPELSIEDLTQNMVSLVWAGLRSFAPKEP